MNILIINFNLNGLARADYEQVCADLAPTFAAIPGLISKHWLANEDTNTYGGVYIWKDKASMLAYMESEIFQSIEANPALANVVANDFEVLAGPSQVTGVN
jgi:quinol monooxygenase YgiN